MKKDVTSDAKKCGIIALICLVVEIIKDIHIWKLGRDRGRKDATEAINEATSELKNKNKNEKSQKEE